MRSKPTASRGSLRARARAAAASCALATIAVAAAAPAQDRGLEASGTAARPGFESGLRMGYAVPMGRATSAADPLSDTYGGQFLAMMELGLRTSPVAFAGVHAALGTGDAGGRLREACGGQVDRCWTRTFRAGIEAILHPDAEAPLHAWFGYGLGYEWAWANGTADGRPVTATHRGLEFGRLMMGLELAVSRVLRVGPFLDLSVGRYASARVDAPWSEERGQDASNGFHTWMGAGVKVSIGR